MKKTPNPGYTYEKITWTGSTLSGDSEDISWGNNPHTWNDVTLLVEVAEIVHGGAQPELDEWAYQQPEKAKRLIRLICKIKGDKIYDERKVVEEGIKIHINDARLVVEKVLGKIYFKKLNKKVMNNITENDDVL